ncbi:TPA: hypothetical protein ACHB00_001291 [Klebsiella pneumoniae]
MSNFNGFTGDNDPVYYSRKTENADGTLINEGTIQAGNSPVIPEGYVMVPKEPTERMVIDGFESEPDESFSKPEVWEAYQDMSGCEQAAYRARLCWAAMLAAAPQLQNAPQNIPEIIPNELIAAVNRLFDSNGSRGCYNAIKCYDAHIEVERLLAVARQEVNHG